MVVLLPSDTGTLYSQSSGRCLFEPLSSVHFMYTFLYCHAEEHYHKFSQNISCGDNSPLVNTSHCISLMKQSTAARDVSGVIATDFFFVAKCEK